MDESLYRQLYLIRRVEEEIARIYPSDKIKSPVHLSIGQEFVSVGACQSLGPDDAVFGTYRGHALYLAKGGDLKEMVAELYGKETGCARGKGGSMHLVAPEAGFFGASAVVGTTIPHAVGYALARRLQGKPGIAVSVFGDGAVEEGVFWESLNFAVLRKLPVVFLCENNLYAIHSRLRDRQPEATIADRVRGFGIPAVRVANGSLDELGAAMREAVEELRRTGEGPRFVECVAYRWKEHVGPNDDWRFGYRDAAEGAPWMENDQVRVFAARLAPERRRAIEQSVEDEVAAAIAFAEASDFPPPAALYADVFKES